ncbi:hypothetical protein PMIN01_11404 [Paraphaeosphaeria minitans]|uniref:Uncharacterized protein n=1 Tax=Paraphaeosphaeria minitans TaxID=565426 RepID=A0A9P6G9X9_9PLEO|nr:hypothetical protein PMIN01_11404 [Paraphaeosphaeria minitans]
MINIAMSWFTLDDITDVITHGELESASAGLQTLPHRSTTPSSECTSAATANHDAPNVDPSKRGRITAAKHITSPAKAWFPCVNPVPTSSLAYLPIGHTGDPPHSNSRIPYRYLPILASITNEQTFDIANPNTRATRVVLSTALSLRGHHSQSAYLPPLLLSSSPPFLLLHPRRPHHNPTSKAAAKRPHISALQSPRITHLAHRHPLIGVPVAQSHSSPPFAIIAITAHVQPPQCMAKPPPPPESCPL